jgi:acetyl esterase/lipase
MPFRIYFTLLIFLCGCSLHGIEFSTKSDSTEYVFSSHGNTGDLYMPEGSGPFPAVVLIHGGSWAGRSRSHMAWIARKLVNAGFVAFNIDYRFAPENHYPAQLEDCKEAVRWLRENSAKFKINPEKIGVFGYSAGAQLAALLGTYQTDKNSSVQAVVAGGGPHNLTFAPENKSIIKFLGVNYNEHPEVFRDASPLFHVSSDDPPMFIYHGTRDEIVDPKHSMVMKQALDKAGVKNELYLVENYGHISLLLFADSPVRRAILFLKQTL